MSRRKLDFHATPEGEVFAHKTSSPSSAYYAIHHDAGHVKGRLEKGRVWLSGPRGFLFSPDKTIRPHDVAVSDAGHLAIADWLDFDTLSCRVRIFDQNGLTLYEKRHRRNAGGIAITAAGDVAIYGTMNPGAVVRIIDVSAGFCMATIDYGCPFYGAEIDPANKIAWLDTDFPDRKFRIAW